MAEPSDKTAEYEELLEESKTAKYVLRLYVSGTTPRSRGESPSSSQRRQTSRDWSCDF